MPDETGPPSRDEPDLGVSGESSAEKLVDGRADPAEQPPPFEGPLDERQWVDRLIAAIRGGHWIVPSVGLPEDVALGEQWPPERSIPAGAIRTALLATGIEADPLGLTIVGARIDGQLDLSHAFCPCPITFAHCFFSQPIRAPGSSIPQLDLTGSHMPGINLDQASVKHNLNLVNVRTAHMSLVGGHVGGDLRMRGTVLSGFSGYALILDGTTIGGGAFLDGHFEATGEVRAHGASIGGEFTMSGASLLNPRGYSLNLEGVTIRGNVFLDEGFKATGEVGALRASFGGQVGMAGASLSNPSGTALTLDHADINGSLFMDHVNCSGTIRALAVTIDGHLVLSGATLIARTALIFAAAKISGDARLDDGLTVTGEIRASDAEIGGKLRLSGATLLNPHRDVLTLDRMIVRGLHMDGGFRAAGRVRAPKAVVEGDLRLSGAELSNHSSEALTLELATIKGRALLNDGFTVTGEVAASGVRIDGLLKLSGSALSNPDGDALTLDRARTSTIRLDDGFTASGTVRALGAIIGGQLVLSGAQLLNARGDAVNLEGATINGTLFLDGGFSADGVLSLGFARIGVLMTDQEPTGSLIASGWRLTDISGPLTELKVARAWLDTAPDWMPFAPSGWYELAAVLDRQGQPSDAKRLRITASNRITRDARGPAKALRILYLLFAAYGYWPLLAALWLIMAALGAVALVACNEWAFATTDGTQPGLGLNPWLYGIATVLPAVTIPGLDKWIVGEAWVVASLIGLKLFGWLQTGILLAGLTGLLKKA